MQAYTPPTPMANETLRLVVAFGISLLLHLWLIFEVSTGRVEQGGHGAPPPPMVARLQARIVEEAEEPLLKAIDRPVPSKVQDYVPPAEVNSAADQAKSATPNPADTPKEVNSPTLLNVPAQLETTYYDMKEVDVRPRALGNPRYPERAGLQNISGKVRFRVFLNELGRVDEATLLEEDPEGWGFGESVLAYLKVGRFKPAMIKGKPVKSVVIYELEFKVDAPRPPE